MASVASPPITLMQWFRASTQRAAKSFPRTPPPPDFAIAQPSGSPVRPLPCWHSRPGGARAVAAVSVRLLRLMTRARVCQHHCRCRRCCLRRSGPPVLSAPRPRPCPRACPCPRPRPRPRTFPRHPPPVRAPEPSVSLSPLPALRSR
eukprot:scaffold8915_cov44-Phaeocystis_antarctica.AAC.2